MKKAYYEINMNENQEFIYNQLMSDERENVIPVYGYLYHSINEIINGNFEILINCINQAIKANEFYKLEKSSNDIIKYICKLCLIDEILLKVYID